jgi:hypothetical protein
MTLHECLERMATRLRAKDVPFAVAGGLAASLYRAQPRFTGDVDLIVALGTADLAKAENLLTEMGFTTGRIRQADFEGGPLFAIKRKTTPVVMVTGRDPTSVGGIGADLLLSALPWVDTALTRALCHTVDFGFGKVPVMTLEDVLLSKLYAFGKSVNRPKDLDDLLSIYETDPKPDLIYLQARIEKLEIRLPPLKKRSLPQELRTLI